MSIFNNMRITDKGKVLYAKAQAGKELHFTKMKVGAGNIDTRNPDTLLDLIDPKYDVGIQSISPNPESKSAIISGMINNGAVTEPTYICEIGLYAEDPDEGEILYGYASAGQYGDYYAPNTVGAFTWNYQINAAIGNAANVTVELSNLVYDYGVINTNTTFIHLSGGNQKEINKSIDNMFKKVLDSNDHIYYCEATGTLNNYRVSIPEYTKNKCEKGMGIAVLINADSTDVSTINVNGLGAIPIKKSNGKDFTNFKAGSIYTMRYNGTNFILQGEGASGNAKSSDLLSGKTAESDNGELVGTIPIKLEQIYTPSTVDQIINAGQYLGENQIIKGDSNLISENIVAGKNVLGIQGTATPVSLGGMYFTSISDTLTITKGSTTPVISSNGYFSFSGSDNILTNFASKLGSTAIYFGTVSIKIGTLGERTYYSSGKLGVKSFDYEYYSGSSEYYPGSSNRVFYYQDLYKLGATITFNFDVAYK